MIEIIEKLQQQKNDIPMYGYNSPADAHLAVTKYKTILFEVAGLEDVTEKMTMGLRSESSNFDSYVSTLYRAKSIKEQQSSYLRVTSELVDAYRELENIVNRVIRE